MVFEGVSVSNILVPQGVPMNMPLGLEGSFSIPVYQNQLSQIAGQSGIAATSVNVVNTLPRQISGTRMPYKMNSGHPIYYNSQNSYRGSVPLHPLESYTLRRQVTALPAYYNESTHPFSASIKMQSEKLLQSSSGNFTTIPTSDSANT